MNLRLRHRRYDLDMLNGPVLPRLLSFALPLMLSSMLQLTFNAADVIVVGRFEGDVALAAVGSPGALINLLVNLFLGLSVGANVVVAQRISSLRHADLILVLSDSQVIGAGRHEELMATCEEYRIIAETQMGEGKEAV